MGRSETQIQREILVRNEIDVGRTRVVRGHTEDLNGAISSPRKAILIKANSPASGPLGGNQVSLSTFDLGSF